MPCVTIKLTQIKHHNHNAMYMERRWNQPPCNLFNLWATRDLYDSYHGHEHVGAQMLEGQSQLSEWLLVQAHNLNPERHWEECQWVVGQRTIGDLLRDPQLQSTKDNLTITSKNPSTTHTPISISIENIKVRQDQIKQKCAQKYLKKTIYSVVTLGDLYFPMFLPSLCLQKRRWFETRKEMLLLRVTPCFVCYLLQIAKATALACIWEEI